MRDLIDLFEAKRPAKLPSNPATRTASNDAVKTAILGVARKLAAPPLFLKTDRLWADQVMQSLQVKKADWLADPENGAFDAAEELPVVADRVWDRVNHVFIGVRGDVEHEETAPGGYISRARERHGVDPDSSDMGGDVESSQWLTAMGQQAEVGRRLSSLLSIADGTHVLSMLRELDAMLDSFGEPITDGGEEPVLVEGMVKGLPPLIPLLLLLYGRA